MNVIDRAKAWIAQDPDPETRDELHALIAEGNREALTARFSGTLEFGTAGLRGLLGAGPTRMNRVTVMRTTAGLCAYLRREVPEVARRGICIGRDARVKSDVFARDVIEVALGAGIPVWTFADVVPTPVVAFAVLELGAAGGVVVTASHNPPDYSGYKVYWENGAQIIPPHEQAIADAIASAPPADQLPRIPMSDGWKQGVLRDADALIEAYAQVVSDAACSEGGKAPIRVAYTALHGVAERTLRSVFARKSFIELESVASQAAPDGAFPTVAFPNPEEPGAMDLVLALGEEVRADLVIANDPDGDRVAVSVWHDGAFVALSGNEIGILLADHLLERHGDLDRPMILSTIVSSPMLGPIATARGARWEQTLTGHKWIQNRALELEAAGYQYVFGYEEALGYAPLRACRDKDGISTAVVVADFAATLKTRGQTLVDVLESLWQQHGFFDDRQISQWFEGPDARTRIDALIDDLRRNPPTRIGDQVVEAMIDLEHRVRRVQGVEEPFTELAPSDVLIFELEGGHFAMIRPSGTEPKLKQYLYAYADVGQGLERARAHTRTLLDRMAEDLSRGSTDC